MISAGSTSNPASLSVDRQVRPGVGRGVGDEPERHRLVPASSAIVSTAPGRACQDVTSTPSMSSSTPRASSGDMGGSVPRAREPGRAGGVRDDCAELGRTTLQPDPHLTSSPSDLIAGFDPPLTQQEVLIGSDESELGRQQRTGGPDRGERRPHRTPPDRPERQAVHLSDRRGQACRRPAARRRAGPGATRPRRAVRRRGRARGERRR